MELASVFQMQRAEDKDVYYVDFGNHQRYEDGWVREKLRNLKLNPYCYENIKNTLISEDMLKKLKFANSL